jgi:hypothetical protein
MAKTSVDIDMEKLDKVRGILGTESIRKTISAAFREVIRMAAVREELEPLMTRALVGICGVTELEMLYSRVTGRPAPAPAILNEGARPRPAPAFVEWLMGLDSGWVTAPVLGLTHARTAAHRTRQRSVASASCRRDPRSTRVRSAAHPLAASLRVE